MKKYQILAFTFIITSFSQMNSAQAVEASAAYGKELYELQGSNSCSFCHGATGTGGKIANAAKLTNPKDWKSFKALGGEAELKKNKGAFLKNLEEALLDLIAKGAIVHNSSFKKPWHDFKKAGGPINAQMLGLAGAPSMGWLTKKKTEGMTKEIAAKSVLMHVKTFDSQGVFK